MHRLVILFCWFRLTLAPLFVPIVVVAVAAVVVVVVVAVVAVFYCADLFEGVLFPFKCCGGFCALVCEQMSRMLDVLEEFLTLHGHTYVRLDGSTGVEKRQRLMDRQGLIDCDSFFLFCCLFFSGRGLFAGLGTRPIGSDF